MGKNIFVNYLGLLGVKHTESLSHQYFNEHPYQYNLYGLSKMLSDYGVENAATRILDKANDITEIQTPFIAQFSSDFVAVRNVEPDKVSFLWKGAKHDLSIAKFIESWTGIIMLAESSKKSIEPNYKKHKRKEKEILPLTDCINQVCQFQPAILNCTDCNSLRGQFQKSCSCCLP